MPDCTGTLAFKLEMGQSALQSGDHRLGTVGHIQAHQYDTHVRLFGGTAGSGSRGEGSILAYGGSAILDGVAMSNSLVGWVLQETDTAGINFVHAVGVLGDIARRDALHNNHLQSGAALLPLWPSPGRSIRCR
jgi:hypothetical protein